VSEIVGKASQPLGSRLLPILLTSARRMVRHTQNVKPYSFVECYRPDGNNAVALFLGLLFDPEDGGSTILRNVDELLPMYTASHPISVAVRTSDPK
jgi:hypothetical protein